MSVAEVPTPSHSTYGLKQHRFSQAPLASIEDLPTDDQHSSSEDEKRNYSVVNNNKSSDIVFIVTDYDRNVANLNSIETPHSTAINLPPHYTECKRKSSWADFFSLRKSPTPTKSKERKFSLFNFNFFTKEGSKTADPRCPVKFEKLVVVSNDCSNVVSYDDPINVQKDEIVSRQVQQLINEPANAIDPIELLHSDGQLNMPDSSIVNSSTNVSIQVQCSDSTYENDQELNNLQSGTSCLVEAECCPYSGANSSIDYYGDNVVVEDIDSCCETDLECADCADCISPSIQMQCNCSVNDTDAAAAADNEDNDEVDSSTKSNLVSFDGELDLLLKDDELDLNNWSTDELHLKPIPVAANHVGNSNKLNLKISIDTVKTSPIDRPRSTTPINVDSFEAYINGFESNNLGVGNCDKLTITLPGPQFNPRNKFTRKSNPYIWQEFCEKGLKSPQILRKRANSCFPQINQTVFSNDAFESNNSPENLTPITPIKDIERDTGQCRFDDNFWDYTVMMANRTNRANEIGDCTKSGKNKVSINNLKGFEINCNCECNSSNTSSAVNNLISVTTCSDASSFSEASDDNETNSNGNELTRRAKSSEYNEDQPLVSPCDCACHQQHLRLTNAGHGQIEFELSSAIGNSAVSIINADLAYTEDSASCTLSPDSSSSTLSSSTSQSSKCSTTAQLIDCSTASNNSLQL